MSTDEKTQDPNSTPNPAGTDGGADPANTVDTQKQPPAPDTVSREAYSALQSKADKAAADARRAREEAAASVESAERSRQQAVLAGLKPEERDAAIKNFDLEARERRLQANEREQEAAAKTLTVKTLALDNGLTTAQLTELENIDDVNEMRARAAEMRSDRLQAELEEARKPGGTQTQTDPKDGKPAPRAMRDPNPAGGGGDGGKSGYDASKFKGTGDLAGALKAKREAGENEYVRIPSGR